MYSTFKNEPSNLQAMENMLQSYNVAGFTKYISTNTSTEPLIFTYSFILQGGF